MRTLSRGGSGLAVLAVLASAAAPGALSAQAAQVGDGEGALSIVAWAGYVERGFIRSEWILLQTSFFIWWISKCGLS